MNKYAVKSIPGSNAVLLEDFLDEDNFPPGDQIWTQTTARLSQSQPSQTAVAGPSSQRPPGPQRAPNSTDSTGSSSHSASQPLSTAEPELRRPAKAKRRWSEAKGNKSDASLRKKARVSDTFKHNQMPESDTDDDRLLKQSQLQLSQSKPALSQPKSSQTKPRRLSQEGIIKPRNSQPLETITITNSDDDPDNALAQTKPVPHRRPSSSMSASPGPGPSHPRSETLAPVVESGGDQEERAVGQAAEKDEVDELADDEWEDDGGYQPPAEIESPVGESTSQEGGRVEGASGQRGEGAEGGMEVDQEAATAEGAQGDDEAVEATPLNGLAASPSEQDPHSSDIAMADLADDEPARPCPSPATPSRPHQSQSPAISSSPSVESASEADRVAHFLRSPVSSSPLAPTQSARLSSSLSPLAPTPAKAAPAPALPPVKFRPGPSGWFPFSTVPPPAVQQAAQLRSHPGLASTKTASGRRLLAPKRSPIANHDRALPRPPPLPSRLPLAQPHPTWPLEEQVQPPIASCPDAAGQGDQAKMERRASNRLKSRLNPANGARPGLAATPARAAAHAPSKLARPATKSAMAGDGKGKEQEGEVELESDPELSEVDRLDFALLEVRDREGKPIGRIEPEALLKSYKRWDAVKDDGIHGPGLDFRIRGGSDLGPGHSAAGIRKMQTQVEANAAFKRRHATTVCVPSSRAPLATDSAVAAPSPSREPLRPVLNTLSTALFQPASEVLPSGWPSLRPGPALDKLRAEDACHAEDVAFLGGVRGEHGGLASHGGLSARRQREKAQRKERIARGEPWEGDLEAEEREENAGGEGEGKGKAKGKETERSVEVERVRHNPRPSRARAGRVVHSAAMVVDDSEED